MAKRILTPQEAAAKIIKKRTHNRIWMAAWLAANREVARARDRARYAVNKERLTAARTARTSEQREADSQYLRAQRFKHIEKRLAREATYRAVNKSKIAADKARWRVTNPTQARALFAAWQAANPDAARANKHRCRARRRDATGHHTPADIVEIKKHQKEKCAYCRVKLGVDYHVDHITALARGGSNGRSNLQVLCPPCNQKKSAKHPLDFAREIGLLL